MSEYTYYTPPKQPYINRKKILITYILIGLNVCVYALMTFLGYIKGWNQSEQLWIFGAKINFLIEMGQYWRLFTCMFLHIGVLHLLSNCYAIFCYGPAVERIYGRAKFTAIYLISGLTSSVFSYLMTTNSSAGASGAIFGMLGCLLYFRERKKEAFKKIFGWHIFLILGLNLVLGFTEPEIDNFGHIGGLIGGYLAAHAIGLLGEDVKIWKRIFFSALIVIFIAVCITGRHLITTGGI